MPGLLLLTGLSSAQLNAQPIANRTVVVARFEPLPGESRDTALEGQIAEQLQRSLQQGGYRVALTGQTAPEALSDANLMDEAFVVLGGFYQRADGNDLSIYGQIYHPEQKRIVDSSNHISMLEQLSQARHEIGLSADELRVPDEEAIRSFARELVLRLASNPQRRIRSQNVAADVLTRDDIAGLLEPYIASRQRELAAAEVFAYIEDQVVVTATRSETRLKEAPAAVYVITARQIRERGYRTLIDALHDIPGFDIIHVYGIFPELIHQRGLVGNNQRTLLYVDGVPDNNITENAILAGSIRFPL
ncbi:MAG: TonB-dependent receptor plug domain-containing protein, partial [Leptospiraceae bacterium]|nr:TonB-dependent receptor plug domain-containing protein [Leptospiraceae bacterium]